MSGVDIIGTYEQIMDALLAYIQKQTGSGSLTPTFQTYARGIGWPWVKSQIWQTVRQPALYLFDGYGLGGGKIQYVQKSRSLPVLRHIERTVVIYAQTAAPGGLPSGTVGGLQPLTKGGGPLFHPLIEAVEAAIEQSDDQQQGTLTLGGLVSHCWIEGDQILVTPDIDDNGQGMATLPVHILVPRASS